MVPGEQLRRRRSGLWNGTVNRVMEESKIGSAASPSRRILGQPRLCPKVDPAIVCRWQVGIATRPCDLAGANGDAFVIRECDGRLLVGVIDGLGHGEPAQQAALAAQSYVQCHFELPLDELFRGVGRACRGTRGVVMALARFESPLAMVLANLGNIEMRAWTGTERLEIPVQRGFLGVREIHVQMQHLRWDPDWMLVLHSDGLFAQWHWDDFPGLQHETPQAVANHLLSILARENDDATILAVKSWSTQL
jgi:serine/threonine protein phosphatase PrpC